MSQKDNSNEKISLNFSVFRKYSNNLSMSSNIISETALEEEYVHLKKKSLLKRKLLSSDKIFYSEIVDLELIKSNQSNLYSAIKIVYSKNGYSKRSVFLSSSDSFAVRWFFDELVVKYSLIRSDLYEKINFKSNEKKWIESNQNSVSDDSFESNSSCSNSIANDVEDNLLSHKTSNQSKLSDFMDSMNKDLSEEDKWKLKKQIKFESCSNGEY